jgi:hypothetical protein
MFENLSQLKTTRAKRIFAVTAASLLFSEFVLLTIVQYKYAKIPEPLFSVMKEVLVNLVGASITGIFLASLLVYLLPIEEALHSVELVDPSRTKVLHDMALMNSDFWFHHGPIGRWVRITAMPALAKASVEKGIATTVKLILLDPRDFHLCSLYAEYRNRIAFKESRIKTLRDVQAELLATIIIGQIFEQSPTGLTVNIFLERQLSLVREDIAELFVFRTQADPRCSAIVFRNMNHDHEKAQFYNTARAEFDFASRCCSELLPRIVFPDGDITTDKIRSYLKGTDLLVHDDVDFLKDVQSRVESDFHPYH